MKKILLILVFISFFTNLSFSSYLNLSLIDNSEFTAMINNISFNRLTRTAEIDNLPGGSHYIKVMKPSSPDNQWNTTIYEGYISILENYNIYASIDEKGNLIIYKRYYGTRIEPYRENTEMCNCDCESCKNCRHKIKPDIERNFRDCDYRIMSRKDFADFKKVINERSFESTKRDMALSVIDVNYFNTEQIRELLNLFGFESTKLEIAKYAFKNTCDKKNYFKLFDVFTFESSIQELDEYIKNYKE
jgi:hypothetical protein